MKRFGMEMLLALVVGTLIVAGISRWAHAQTSTTRRTVSCERNPEADMSHYNVYVSETTGGPYTFFKRMDHPSDVATRPTLDVEIPAGRDGYFVLTAVDTSGNESGYSAEVRADTVAPAIPRGVELINLMIVRPQ